MMPDFQEETAYYVWTMKEPDPGLVNQIVTDDATGLYRLVFPDYLGVEFGFGCSAIKLNKDLVLIDELGRDYTPFAMTKYGAWGTKAVRDMLPAGYEPDE
ncbi:MAG TPA: hypothetical protein EYQ20_21830 [candidate division Zixibacteria bacterium]|jgi:hypothetical protein|nr:hypothetical protein [candidate division Zixibacteria bacterium]